MEEGKSVTSLVTNLNQLGILTQNGKVWSRQQMIKILRNAIYAGRAYWRKNPRNDRTLAQEKDAGERILIPVTTIVSESVFDRVQRRLDKNRVTFTQNTKHLYLLQHLLQCRVCGKSFTTRVRNKSHGRLLQEPERYYGCIGMKKSPGAYNCRKTIEIYTPTLEKVVWDKVAQTFSEPTSLLEILRARNDASAGKAEQLKSELTLAKEQLSKKNLELQQVLSWARQRLLSADELKPQLAQAREQREHWEEEVTRLSEKLKSIQTGEHDLEDAESFCQSI